VTGHGHGAVRARDPIQLGRENRGPGRLEPADRLAKVDGADELEQVYREEATRIRAALAARLGDVGLAEELVQDAFIEALEHWPAEGVPPNPGGWLATTARRKAIDRLRRERTGQQKLALLAATQPRQAAPDGRPGGSYDPGPGTGQDEDDELLGLIFACCHPSLPRESQIALTLRAVCGLTTAEISAAFLVSEPAMGQRLSRARKTLRDTGSPVRIPEPDQLRDRLDEVLAIIYLVFNEGYLASAGRTPARRDLAARAVALNRLLHRLMPREPEVLGLLALLLWHESRAATRFDGWGRLVRLQDQDRARWDRSLAAEATSLLSRAMAMHRPGPYQIQAAIAAVHGQAPSYESTDWRQIRLLYDRLDLLTPSPVVRLNRAVATRFAIGPQAALAEVEPLADELDGYRLFHAVRAELLDELGRHEQARAANERALALAANPAERELLARRLSP
jgi:RNA polymerase sigma factor (sigma-70 family)